MRKNKKEKNNKKEKITSKLAVERKKRKFKYFFLFIAG
jgi:hypothetical protein